jgi:hypothetical protein
MENYDDFGNLEEKVYGEKISERVRHLKLHVDLDDGDIDSLPDAPIFTMGYCASNNENFERFTEYVREYIGIDKKSVREVELTPDTPDLADYFIGHKDELKNLPGEIIMVKARGFEKQDRLQLGYGGRRAHDYDQNVVEGFHFTRELIKGIKGLDKKIVVVTHIGYSKGKEFYDAGVKSALQSQFKKFFFEIGEEDESNGQAR